MNQVKNLFIYAMRVLYALIFILFCYTSNYLSGIIGNLHLNFKYKSTNLFNLSEHARYQFYEFINAWWHDNLPLIHENNIRTDAFMHIGIASIVLIFISLLFYMVYQAYNSANNYQIKIKTHGNARFANQKEIQNIGLLSKLNHKHQKFQKLQNKYPYLDLSQQHQQKPSIVLGKFNQEFLYFEEAKFVALAAPTRSGKGVGIVIPNLLHWQSSLVCLDIKGENFDKTSGYRAQFSQVYKFDPFNEQTHCYNPLSYISRNSAKTISDIQTIARILWPYNDKEPIWNDSSCNLFQGLLLFLFDQARYIDINIDMFNLFQLAGEIGTFDQKTWQKSLSEQQIQLSPRTLSALNSYFTLPQETRTSVLGTFNAQMQLFSNPTVAASTSKDDFNLSNIRKEKQSIYVCVAPNRLSQASKLLNIFFSQLIQVNTEELPEQNYALKETALILLDEFTALGKVDIIETAISYIAGYNLRLLLIYQSQSQLSSIYGKESAQNMITNCGCQIIFAPKEQQDAEEYSKILGNTTIKVQNYSYNKGGKEQSGKNLSFNEQERPLMLPQELKNMGKGTEIIILEDILPIKAQKILYYADDAFKRKLLPKISVPSIKMQNEWLGIQS